MAFNRPIEADQVDDFGLFSTFIRAPLVGVIMWALGGDEAKRQEEEQRDRQAKHGGEEEPPIPPTQLQQMISHNRMKKKGKKMPPRLIGSDLSDFGHLAIQSESDIEDTEDDAGGGLKRNKKMSWSDESGQSLCEVADEVSLREEDCY